VYGNTVLVSAPPYAHFLGGVLSGLAVSPFSIPANGIKYWAETPPYMDRLDREGIFACTREIFTDQKISSLFRGWRFSLVSDSLSYGSFFWTWNIISSSTTLQSNLPDSFCTIIAGVASGLAFNLFNYPAEIFRAAMVTEKTSFKITFRNFREKGLLSLYEGMGRSLKSSLPAAAVAFLVYDKCNKYLSKNGAN